MKVLHFYKTYYPDSFGGVEQVIYQLANGSRHLGIDTKVLSLTRKSEPGIIELSGHKVVRCRSNFNLASTDFSFSAFWKFNELAKNVDIIHYHFPWPFMDMISLLSNTNKPSVVTYHSDIVRQKNLLNLYRPLKNKFLKSVNSIVATSPNYLMTSNVLQLYRDKVDIIPIGLDRDLYSSASVERTQFWRSRLGNKFFLFIGVLRYYKGLNVLLEALALDDLPTVIVGAGPIESELKYKADLLGLKNIFFLGQVSENDKVAILDLSYAVVFPSHLRSEAFGVSLLEGAMFGKPLISSEIGSGTSFVNIHENTGIVVEPSSPKALNIAMKRLWKNPDLAKQMGGAASARFLKLFTADKMCQSYKDLYSRLISGKSK